MDQYWVMLVVVWAVVELVQFFRKKPFRARMKSGAWWGVVLTSLAIYGQPHNHGLSFLFISFAIAGIAALVVFWARVGLAIAWARIVNNEV